MCTYYTINSINSNQQLRLIANNNNTSIFGNVVYFSSTNRNVNSLYDRLNSTNSNKILRLIDN